LGTLLNAGPLFISVTSPQPIIPQLIFCINVN
jgi:hypothetical protein